MEGDVLEVWRRDIERQELCSILEAKYDLYANRLFSGYEPTSISSNSVSRDFIRRMSAWLNNFTDDELRWKAFQFIDSIFFISTYEFSELYRIAFDQIIPEWVASCSGLSIFSLNDQPKIEQLIDKTWFCPLTDSLRISAFRHVNHIEHPEYFPDWRSLERFTDSPKKILDYIREKEIELVVLMEDFVGSGRQVSSAIEFAAKSLPVPVLALPLIIGLKGHDALTSLADTHPNLTYRHVVLLDERCCVEAKPGDGEVESCLRARLLCDEFTKVSGDTNAFGFEVERGYFFVSHANCPNNTIKPVWASEGWVPLFPRSGRRGRMK